MRPEPEQDAPPSRLNAGHDYAVRVGGDAHGASLIDHLARRFPHSSRAAWAERIERGQVRLDGGAAAPDAQLRRGQLVVWHRPPWIEPAAPTCFALLWRDADLLAVAKPAGLPTLPGAGFLEHTLSALVQRFDPRAKPMHRLGRFTSGVVLCGRSPGARADLAIQWTRRTVLKRYRALAEGDPAADEFTIDVPIGPVHHPRLGTVHAASRAGRPATTKVSVLERRGDRFLCDVWIETGRPHQIRIHLAAAGHPLCGDPLYGPGGSPRAETAALPGDPGYLLHAAELGLLHPRTGAPWRIECAPPPVLRIA